MESSEILVKVNCEEVKCPLSIIQRILIRTNVFLEVVLGFSGEGSYLLVTPSIAGNE